LTTSKSNFCLLDGQLTVGRNTINQMLVKLSGYVNFNRWLKFGETGC